MSSQLLVANLFEKMNKEPTNQPWLFCEDTEENQPLVGNRAGFEVLRNSIDLLLSGESKSVILNAEDLGFGDLVLQDHPDPVEQDSFGSKFTIFIIISIFFSIPILALYGLYSLISKFL